jgi:hypothetical protein
MPLLFYADLEYHMTGLSKFIPNIVKEKPTNRTNFVVHSASVLIKTQFPLLDLKGEGLIRSQALAGNIGGKVSITHEGLVEAEEAITNPQVNSAR